MIMLILQTDIHNVLNQCLSIGHLCFSQFLTIIKILQKTPLHTMLFLPIINFKINCLIENGTEDTGRGKGKLGGSERVAWTYIYYIYTTCTYYIYTIYTYYIYTTYIFYIYTTYIYYIYILHTYYLYILHIYYLYILHIYYLYILHIYTTYILVHTTYILLIHTTYILLIYTTYILLIYTTYILLIYTTYISPCHSLTSSQFTLPPPCVLNSILYETIYFKINYGQKAHCVQQIASGKQPRSTGRSARCSVTT